MTFVNLFRNPTAELQGMLYKCSLAFPEPAERQAKFFFFGSDFATFIP